MDLLLIEVTLYVNCRIRKEVDMEILIEVQTNAILLELVRWLLGG